MNSVTDLKT